MDLLQNPFHILTTSPRDNRRKIMELADERSLLFDSNLCTQARSELTNPRKRLTAEVAWLPGLGPKHVGELLVTLENSPSDLFSVDKLTSIARSNLLASGLSRLINYSPDDIAEWILEISWAFESVDAEELRVIVNEERVVSGFPEVTDLSALETEIQERRRYYRQVIKNVLDNLSAKKLVEAVTVAVESATNVGEEHGPILIADLVDSYEVEAQEFLEKEEENIKSLVKNLRVAVESKRSDTVLAPMVNLLISIVRNWDSVAQPIQVSTQSRGLDHEASQRVAWHVRSLAIDMFNEHNKLEFSQQLTNMLQQVFAEVVDVAERTAEDANSLDEIAEDRVRLIEDSKTRKEEWRREITYEADVGAIFKDKLSISPEGIIWKGRQWDLDSITRIRWGGTRHSVNGISTGTTYKIIFGNNSKYESIELKKETTYTNFIDRLWRSVGVRLLTEYLEGLRGGGKYIFGSAYVKDEGMVLQKNKLFGANEQFFCKWDDLSIGNGGGTFFVRHKNDKKLSASFEYQAEDNIHVLEAMIRMFWKRGGNKISELLEG